MAINKWIFWAVRVSGSQEDHETAIWLLREKLLKKKRYANLGLQQSDIQAIAAQAADNPAPSSVKDRMLVLEERLKGLLDDRAAALAVRRPACLGQVAIQKLQPRRDRKELHYDHKPGKSSKPIRFCDLNFDPEKYAEVEDYVGHEVYKLERKHGSEGEQARLTREEKEAAIERAAGTIRLAPVLEGIPRICGECGEPIPGEAKRFVILRAELPCVGLEITAIQPLVVMCEKCQGTQPSSTATKDVDDDEWMESLTSNEREALRLKDQGLNQTEIADRMAKDQTTISRILRRVEGKRKASMAKKLRSTGGA